MSSPRKRWTILSNWKLKLLSIALAMIIWSYVKGLPHEVEPNLQEISHENALLRDALRECDCSLPSEVPP